MSDYGFREAQAPVIAHGVNFLATVKFPSGDWREWEIDRVTVDDSERDIYDLILDAPAWEDVINEQVADYMFGGEWRHVG